MAKSKKRSSRRKSLGKRIGNGFNSLTEAIEKFFKNFFGNIGKAFSFIGSLIIPTSLTKKVNKATKSTGKKVGKRVGAITEQVEKKFTKSATGFFSTFGYILQIFVPKSLLDWFGKRSKAISKWFGKFFKRLGKGFTSWAENYLPKWMVDWGKAFSKKARRARRTTSKFTTAWWKSRDYNALALSTPAFLLMLPLVSTLVLANLQNETKKQLRYVRVMFDALEEKEYAKADLCRKKLSQLNYRKGEMLEFTAALVHLKEIPPDYETAYEKIKRLAPLPEFDAIKNLTAGEGLDSVALDPTKPDENDVAAQDTATEAGTESTEIEELQEESQQEGLPAAHLWISGALMRGDISEETDAARWLVMKAHADAALKIEPNNKFGKYLHVKYFEGTSQIDKAVGLMEKLKSDYPEFNGELMQQRLSAGNQELAKLAADNFIRYARDNESQLVAIDYAYWSAALQLQGQVEKAAQRAREGGRKYPDHPDIRNLAAISVLAQLNRTEQTSPEFLPLLCEAHGLNQDNQVLVNRLAARLAYEPFKVESLLEEMKEKKTVTANVFITAGELHLRGGRVPDAMKYFQEAIDYEPESGLAYNNMAWVMGNAAPKRLQAALVAANKAIEIEALPEFFETRGQIHLQLEDWEAARSDLEIALRGMLVENDRLRAHSSLATIYTKLGKHELASAHQASSQRQAASNF